MEPRPLNGKSDKRELEIVNDGNSITSFVVQGRSPDLSHFDVLALTEVPYVGLDIHLLESDLLLVDDIPDWMIHFVTDFHEVLDSLDWTNFLHEKISLKFSEIQPEILDAFYEELCPVDSSLGEIEMPSPLRNIT